MLSELLGYTIKLLNNMTTTVTTTTTTVPVSTIIRTTTSTSTINNNKKINNSTKSSISNSTAATHSSAAQHSTPSINPEHSTDSFNASIKTLFHKTLNKVSKAKLSDFTAQYTELPPLSRNESVAVGPTGGELSATLAADMVTAAATTLPVAATRHLAETTTAFPVQTVATLIAGNKNRATTIIVYPTVSPESIVIPIVSCIFGFPILALIVICCLRRRAKLARERDRRRNYDMQDHAVSLVRFSPIHRLNYRSSRAISLRPERSLSQGFTSLELDTVMEERCSDIEQTQTEILNAESPMETNSYKMSFSS